MWTNELYNHDYTKGLDSDIPCQLTKTITSPLRVELTTHVEQLECTLMQQYRIIMDKLYCHNVYGSIICARYGHIVRW